jgi:hypothetical protein
VQVKEWMRLGRGVLQPRRKADRVRARRRGVEYIKKCGTKMLTKAAFRDEEK